ncbi:MAG: hypothetical protein H6687_02570 [Bacillales bacterium]|nr:hypothetical protein [Bacillales bacterium]
MEPIEIIVIIISVLIVGGVTANAIYRKIKHLPIEECSACSYKNGNSLIKEYHKKYKKDS